MVSLDLSTRECDGRVVVALCGELDVADAARVVAALAAVTGRQREIIVDLAGLEFIDSSGLAALACVRKQARHAGGDVLLAAPQEQVLRFLALTRMLDVFSVHASVDEAAGGAGRSRQAAVPVLQRRRGGLSRLFAIMRPADTSPEEGKHRNLRKRAQGARA
jgi:anti-sigma B factor antagonist